MVMDVWSIAIIVIAFQGLFLLSVLLFSKDRKHIIGRRYLIATILVLLWFLIEFFTIRNKIDVGLNFFYGTRYGSWFLLGPLLYFYFKSVVDAKWKFTKKQWLHFVPFVLFVIVIPWIAYQALANRQVDYGMLSVFDHREKSLTTIQWAYSVVFVLQFVHLGIFLFKNIKLVKIYSKGLHREYSVINGNVRWLKIFNVVTLLVLGFTAIFLYVLLISDIYRRHLDYIYVIPLGIIFYFLSYKFIRSDFKPVENGSKYSGSSLSKDKIPTHIARLNELMNTEKVYLNNVIRLSDLAQQIPMSKHHLSQLINQEYQLSFYDFVNQHRVKEAKEIIKSHPEYKLIQVAFDAGFNNKTSFVNAFKKFEGITPSKFRDRIAS